MKRFIALTVFLIILLVGSASAQRKVYLCESYTNSGQPIGADIEWTMPETGGAVYILFTNGGDLIPWNEVYFIIDKYSGGKYTEFESKTLTPDKTKAWLIYDYTFYEAGSFKVTVMNPSGEKLASEFFDILVKSPKSDQGSNPDAEIVFCLDIDEDINPVDVGTEFYIDKVNGSYIYLYVDNKTAFNTTSLIVDFWKGNDYGEFVETKEYTIQEQWVATYFKYTFRVAGDYKVMVYRDDQSLIVSGYVTIKYN